MYIPAYDLWVFQEITYALRFTWSLRFPASFIYPTGFLRWVVKKKVCQTVRDTRTLVYNTHLALSVKSFVILAIEVWSDVETSVSQWEIGSSYGCSNWMHPELRWTWRVPVLIGNSEDVDQGSAPQPHSCLSFKNETKLSHDKIQQGWMQTHSKVHGKSALYLYLSLILSPSLSNLPSTMGIVHSEWVLEEVILKFAIKPWLPCQAIPSHPVENVYVRVPWPFLVLNAKGSQSMWYHWKSRV